MSMLEGGCACGAIRYASETAPVFAAHCCCRQCQRITGAGHASQFGVPAAALTFRGTPKHYELRADSGNTVTSAFCAACGSPIYKRSSGHAGLYFLHAATLDDPSAFRPERVVWASRRQPWDHLDPGLALEG